VPRFETILFDLDGTLTDPRIAITTSIAHALREVGVTPPPLDQLTWCIGPPLRQNLGRIMGAEPTHLIERAVELYFHRYAAEGVRETILYPGVDAMLRRLRGGGASLYLASAKLTAHAAQALAAFSLLDYFAGVYGSARDGSLADKVELIRSMVEKTGIIPERARNGRRSRTRHHRRQGQPHVHRRRHLRLRLARGTRSGRCRRALS
jgi:phosphoglycolate phosphatase